MFNRLESVNRIILSAGHGGMEGERYDPGATFQQYTENAEVKQIINRLVPKLTQNALVVVVTPDYGLARTITYLNAQYDAVTDWAFEIHKDSAPRLTPSMHRRMGVYFHPTSPDSKKIAEEMVQVYKENGAATSSWSRPDTASNHKRLAWIRQPKMLTYLIECGFMQDNLGAESDDFYATLMAQGICHCLGVPYR